MGEDESSLEKRLFSLMKEYEQPVDPPLSKRLNKFSGKTPLLRSKKLKYSGCLPYHGEIMMKHSPTLSERVSNFWHERSHTIKNIIRVGTLVSVIGVSLTGVSCLASYLVLDNILSPGVKMESGLSHTLFLKNRGLPGLYYPPGVYISNADGSDMEVLVGGYEWEQPALSPNEKKIALVRRHDGLCEIFAINTNGSKRSQVTLPNRRECDHNPFWSDSNTIGFLRSNGEEQYFLIELDENNIGYNLRPYDP